MKGVIHTAAVLLLILSPTASMGAQFYPGGSREWGPNGDGTLDYDDDLRWVFFHDAKVTADEVKGECRASSPPNLAKEEGRQFETSGYMLAVDATTTSPPSC